MVLQAFSILMIEDPERRNCPAAHIVVVPRQYVTFSGATDRKVPIVNPPSSRSGPDTPLQPAA
jgi:hypothetical protein